MPLPKRKKGETHQQFIERCMSNRTMVKEFPDAAPADRTTWPRKRPAPDGPRRISPGIAKSFGLLEEWSKRAASSLFLFLEYPA